MELRQLKYFVAVAEELHYGRAATRLRISTPTLSQQMAALERALRTRLIDRNSHRVSLTAAGEALLDQARLVLVAAERARDAVEAAGRISEAIDVRVTTGLEHVLVDELAALDRDLDVNLMSTNGQDAEQAVLQGRAVAALTWARALDAPQLQARVLRTAEVMLALPMRHELAALDRVPVSALADVPIALFPRHLASGVWDLFVAHLLPHGPQWRDQILYEPTRLAPMTGMLMAVSQGRGVAPFVAAVAPHAAPLSADGIVLRPMDPELHMPVELVWRAPASAQVRRLLSVLGSDPGSVAGQP
ncbi:MAG: Transcriptional regulator, LysR family protein [Frankiales bacterium]|jgi:DNA-binding transcriptional LysR family regulator|nr:Transcriptional regulator, LysR family protein [Frankiales bacterium]